MKNVIALDVSMGKSYCALYEDGVFFSEFEIPHTQTGFDCLKTTICNYEKPPQIVFESTGVYSKVVETFCLQNNYEYFLLNPLETKKQLDGLRIHKTDRSDAHKLAQSHYQFSRKPKQTQLPIYDELRDLARFYHELEHNIKLSRMRMHNALQLTFPELETLFANRVSRLALNIISIFPHPEMIRPYSRTRIKNILLANTEKNISQKKALEKAELLLNLAQFSFPAVSIKSFQIEKVRYESKQLQGLILQKENLVKEMIEKSNFLPEFHILYSMPGIGKQTAVLLIGELGDIRRFSDSKKLNAFVGIDIRRYQSGKSQAQDHINKRGNKKARMILYFAIRNMVRQQHAASNHIVDYYYKLKKQPNPKREKVAIIACVNRLIKCIHYLVNTGTLYDYSLTSHG